MRIMLIVNEYPDQILAGTAVATRGLATALARRGHQIHVVVTSSFLGKDSGGQERLEVTWLKDRPLKGIGVLWRLLGVLKVARTWKPDILQGQSVSCGLLAALAGRWLRVPSITYAQGQDVYQSGILQNYTEIRWACRWSSAVVAVTNRLSSLLEQRHPPVSVQVIPHGFNPEAPLETRQMIRHKCGTSEETLVVLNVGRLEQIKGQDLLLEAWPLVRQKIPAAHLWLVGEGSRRPFLEQRAEKLQIASSVHFWGQLKAAEVTGCMAAADLFVLPSRSEAFGIVLLEAMSQGLPIVASDVGGIPEVLPPRGDAVLTPPGDAPALASAIISELSRRRWPSQANRDWARHFAWDENVLRFENLYRFLLP